jgi:hypothetical protein
MLHSSLYDMLVISKALLILAKHKGKIHLHGREPVEAILKVALVRTESPAMQAVVDCARHLLDVLQ